VLLPLTSETEPRTAPAPLPPGADGPDGSEADAAGAHREPLSARRSARLQFFVASTVAVLVIGALGALALHRVATHQAIEDARAMTAAFARGAIAPALTAEALAGEPTALARLDRVVRRQVLHDPVVRVKVWQRDGRIAYSDADGLIGRREALSDDLRGAFSATDGRAEVSDLSRPENRFERAEGELVEVYLPVRAETGETVVVETYQLADSIDSAGQRLWGAFLPVLVLVLLALATTQLPLAIFHTRRVRQHERERERLMRRADDRVEAERLRIAAELHDGVVQDLVGVAYELRAVADDLPDDPHAEPGMGLDDILRRSEHSCRNAVRALRSLLVELRPGERRAVSLETAIHRLAEPLRERGVRVPVVIALERDLPPDVAELVHRALQEALRNVARHAGARTAEVTITDDGSSVRLRVEDDGRGMTAADLEEQHAAGHMGLRLLADGIGARGGSLEIESEPGTGTRLALWLPWS
jgi:signal transduction histidine kinase